MTDQEIYTEVASAVAAALALDEDEVTPESTLMDELGAESIDLLDILFRLERSLGVKIQAADLGDHLQGGMPDEEFADENEVVTSKGMEQIKQVMPQIDAEGLSGSLKADEVMSHFTVQNLADMVASRVRSTSA